ncbi:MAG TPA: methyl-accepting chemotaxis protein [Methanospirillum sp.]|nr:methyl-accepting chemotaxis protein [Methanospirillum sp.]
MQILDQINNSKIGTRLIGGFIIVTLLMSLIGIIGFLGMNSIASDMDKVYSQGTVPLLEISNTEVSLNSIRALVFRTASIPAERDQDEKRMEDEIKNVDSLLDQLGSVGLAENELKNLTLFEKQWTEYKSVARNVFTLLKDGKEDAALISISNGGDHANARRATVETFTNLKTGIVTRSKAIADAGQQEKNKTVPIMATFGIIVVIIALSVAVLLTRSITIPLSLVMDRFGQMSRGDISGRLNLTRADEIGQMAGMFDRFNDFLEHDVVDAMHSIAQGDLTVEVTPKSADDQISPALSETLIALKTVIAELGRLSEQASAGDLTVRGDPGSLAGSYREILLGFNKTLDALINPLNGAILLSREYAGCNFTARFSKDVLTEGDFMVFRQALDAIGSEVSSALQVVNTQIQDLSEQAEKASYGIEDVRRGAGIIADNAEQTQDNAQRSEEGIAQVLQAMEDLTRTVSSVSTNVEMVAQAGASADLLAKKGILSAATAEEGMVSIRRSSAEVESIIKDIQGQMNEITKIIGIITDISEQTNLLALNAAIEAARAGDAGLGFAVVAGEVKALATQTGSSAQQIAAMIQGLDKQSRRAVEAMEGAGEAISHGGIALQDTVGAFNQLTVAVGEISQNMASVAGATEEQAASFEEITASITEMNGQVKETAKGALNSSATAEEALAVVEQITGIITEINTVVSTTSKELDRFKVR